MASYFKMMLTNLKRLYIKVGALGVRLLRMAALLPLRVYRFLRHLKSGITRLFKVGKPKIYHWWQDFSLFTLDLLMLPEIAETLADFIKWNTRPLSPSEKKLAKSVFGNALNLDAVRVDENARIGCRKMNIAYVSYFTINNWGRMRPEILIHELVHVWQYQKLGGAYISMALRAQQSKEGYNYGGVLALKDVKLKNGKITDFNLEQQAEIISDYYLVREGGKPAWGDATRMDLPIYEYFMAQIKN